MTIDFKKLLKDRREHPENFDACALCDVIRIAHDKISKGHEFFEPESRGKVMAKTQQQTSMTKWDAELAKMAQANAKQLEGLGGGNFISLKSGVMSYKGGNIPQNTLEVVVIDFILEHDFFGAKYDAEHVQAPKCFAFGRDVDELRPHEKSHEKQSDQCKGCPQNEWGTADTGKGKACQNRFRLGLITSGDIDNISGAEIAYLKTPITSGKAWMGYVNQITFDLKRPVFGVVTRIKLVPDKDKQFKLEFELVGPIDKPDRIEALFAKRAKVEKEIEQPYVWIEAAAAPAKKGKGAAAGKGRKF